MNLEMRTDRCILHVSEEIFAANFCTYLVRKFANETCTNKEEKVPFSTKYLLLDTS